MSDGCPGGAGGLAGCRGPVLVVGPRGPGPAAQQPAWAMAQGWAEPPPAGNATAGFGQRYLPTADAPAVPAPALRSHRSSVPGRLGQAGADPVERLPQGPSAEPAQAWAEAAGSRLPHRLQGGAGHQALLIPTCSVDHRRRWRLGAAGQPDAPRPCFGQPGLLAVGKPEPLLTADAGVPGGPRAAGGGPLLLASGPTVQWQHRPGERFDI